MYSIPEYDGLRAAVFYDYISKEDGRFYYEKWYYDHGWEQTPDGEGWRRARYEYERPIRGTMYIHPRRRVAIYFFPGGTYDVFSVRFEKDEE